MYHHVTAKQPNSKMCFVCGLKNSFGLRSFFYELDNDELLAIFKPMQVHESYPGRLHGGIATAILDETIGRSIMMRYAGNIWGVTLEFTTRFKKPIPINEELRVIGRVTKETNRAFEGTGAILLKDGHIAAEGQGKFLKLPVGKIGFDIEGQEWQVVSSDSDPKIVDV
jgi:acyl-coenzyme A thioesterase PaaI-like protein